MLNTIHLQTFLTVVDSGSYSAAAARLHMSQPAVSQHIRALEAQFDGMRLFRRVGQQMVPTHAGEELIAVAQEMLALSGRAEENLKALRGQVSGHVTLGCTPSSGETFLSPLLATFRVRFPAIRLSVAVATLEIQLEWLATQQVNVLVVEESQRRRGWESQLLGIERLVLIAPRGHELLQLEQAPPGALRNMPLILPRSGSSMRRVIEDGLRRRGIGTPDIQVAIETDGVGLMVEAVRQGMGLAFVPQTRVPRGRDTGIVALAGLNLQQEWYALRSRERAAPRAIQELYAYIVSADARKLLVKEGLQAPDAR